MSEQFYNRFINFFANIFILQAGFLLSILFVQAYYETDNFGFLVAYYGMIAGTAGLIVKYYRDLQDFKGNLVNLLSLYFPPTEKEQKMELGIFKVDAEEDTDLPVRVCIAYRNGATYKRIADEFGFDHPNITKRNIIKGLDILLTSYFEKNGKHENREVENGDLSHD